MSFIYEPTGRAKEYAQLALNVYTGCNHGCKYPCFNKAMPWFNKEKFENPKPREGLLPGVLKDCEKLKGDPREVLLCFSCDPYPHAISTKTTRQCLWLLETYKMKATILTKGGTRAVRDFDILKRNDWAFGTSLAFASEHLCSEWEPGAATIQDRIAAMIAAKNAEIRTWVSVEPVIDIPEAIECIADLLAVGCIDYWKIGRWNHNEQANKMDWPRFYKVCKEMLKNQTVFFKSDLIKAAT
jgi:DNA repair photolyase